MSKSVFVVPGTGTQGKTVTQHLLERDHAVHILTRNLTSDTAKYLDSKGAKLHLGTLLTIQDIQIKNVDAIFFAVPASPFEIEGEITYAHNILDFARRNDIQTAICSTVARTGEHKSFPGWSDDYPLAWYWKNKHEIENLTRQAGFKNWTILRPAAFYQNFSPPMVDRMYPGLTDEHELRVAYYEDTRLDLIDVKDIAKFTASVLECPEKFSGHEIGLAGEKLTAAEIAENLGNITEKNIKVKLISDEEVKELKAKGAFALDAYIWQRDIGYGVDIEALKKYGIKLNTISEALNRESLGW